MNSKDNKCEEAEELGWRRLKMMKSEIEEERREWRIATIMKSIEDDYDECRWRIMQMMKSENEEG